MKPRTSLVVIAPLSSITASCSLSKRKQQSRQKAFQLRSRLLRNCCLSYRKKAIVKTIRSPSTNVKSSLCRPLITWLANARTNSEITWPPSSKQLVMTKMIAWTVLISRLPPLKSMTFQKLSHCYQSLRWMAINRTKTHHSGSCPGRALRCTVGTITRKTQVTSLAAREWGMKSEKEASLWSHSSFTLSNAKVK